MAPLLPPSLNPALQLLLTDDQTAAVTASLEVAGMDGPPQRVPTDPDAGSSVRHQQPPSGRIVTLLLARSSRVRCDLGKRPLLKDTTDVSADRG